SRGSTTRGDRLSCHSQNCSTASCIPGLKINGTLFDMDDLLSPTYFSGPGDIILPHLVPFLGPVGLERISLDITPPIANRQATVTEDEDTTTPQDDRRPLIREHDDLKRDSHSIVQGPQVQDTHSSSSGNLWSFPRIAS